MGQNKSTEFTWRACGVEKSKRIENRAFTWVMFMVMVILLVRVLNLGVIDELLAHMGHAIAARLEQLQDGIGEWRVEMTFTDPYTNQRAWYHSPFHPWKQCIRCP